MPKLIFITCFLFISHSPFAQHHISLDCSEVTNTKIALNGINVSIFYHFNESLSGGVEINRFFNKNFIERENNSEHTVNEIDLSVWEFSYNFHYNISISKHWKFYPIMGFSHTSDKEKFIRLGKVHTDHFWSFNTGLGIKYAIGKISPHVEYLFTWGKINQEFLLVGFSYELKLAPHKNKIRLKE